MKFISVMDIVENQGFIISVEISGNYVYCIFNCHFLVEGLGGFFNICTG